MTWWRRCTIVAAIVLSSSAVANAWLRRQHEDAPVVERSELIVIAHLDKDSIKYVRHEKTGEGGRSWEHHATLVVTEVLKGTLKETQIPIVINYGLDPRVGGRWLNSDNPDTNAPDPAIPKDRVEIYDTGNSAMSFSPVLADAQKDNLWFLRHLGGELGRDVGEGSLGIADPEDVAPLQLKDYFKALLSKDVDEQVGRLLDDADEVVTARALRFLTAQHRPRDAARIARGLSSRNQKVQALAAAAMAEVADVSAVPMFRKALMHGNVQVRVTACSFLCRFRDTESIPAIGKLMQDFNATQRVNIIINLPRMESRKVVDLLLDQLDERLSANASSSVDPYRASVEAAKAVRTLTGIEFPLDTAQAREIWDKFKGFDDETLIRKSILEDIEALTDKTNYHIRQDAYEALSSRTNQHLGSYDAFHSLQDTSELERSQALWRAWAKQNITHTRADWVYAGFAASGIKLAQPLDAESIDALIAAMEFYGDLRRWATAPVEGGTMKASFHRYSANWLLEQSTGYRVGFSPYRYDVRVNPQQNVSAERWAAWWKENRNKAKLLSPQEKPVTAEMIAKVPSMRLPPPPLSITIQPKSEAHGGKDKVPLTIIVEVKNTSSQDVLVADRPYESAYTCSLANGSTGSGGACYGGEGWKKDRYVTLKPGQTITWEQTDANMGFSSGKQSLENLQYGLTYAFAGSQFGLNAWRGKLLSNIVNCRVEVETVTPRPATEAAPARP